MKDSRMTAPAGGPAARPNVPRLVFIGGGNMASAIAQGLLRAGWPPSFKKK
jgi:hypothetical protein